MLRKVTHGHDEYHKDGQCPEKLHRHGEKIRKAYMGFPGHCIKIRFKSPDYDWKPPYHMVILFGEGKDFWFYNNKVEAEGMAVLKGLKGL